MFYFIDRPPIIGEIIEWIDPAHQMPDADETVLIIMGGDVEASMGFFDGERWLDVSAFPLGAAPIYWAHLPEGPAL